MDTHPENSESDVKTSLASHVVADSTEVVRSGMSRIMTNTINNTLQELGYFPGIVHALADVRTELAKMRDQNGRLIADNTTLARVVAQQREQLKQLLQQYSCSESHVPLIQSLQQQIQQLKGDRENILHTQSQYLQENRFLHTELERVTAGVWHEHNNLVPPSRLMKHKHAASHMSPTLPMGASPPGNPPINHPSNHPSNHPGYPSSSVFEQQPPGLRPTIPFTPGPSRSSQIPRGSSGGAPMDACKPYQGVRSGLPPTARSPIANSFDQARNRSITLPAFSASASSPIPSTPQGQGIPRKWSTPVIDLTQDDNGKVDNAPTAFVEQRVMKRRRTEDDLPRHGPPSSTHLDMRAMGTAINTLDQQARLLPFASLSVNTTPVTTPLVDVLLPAQPPSASVSLTPATEGVLTAEPKVMVANAEENEEEEEDEDTEMTDIWDENGLVKVEICIDAAFDEVEGKIICKMCEFRSQNFDGTSSEPMTDTSQDALVKHCEVEHPAGWGTLRRGNRQEKQEEEPSSMSKDVPVKDG